MSYQVVNLRPPNAGGSGDLFIGQRSDNGERVVVKYLHECHAPYARKAFAREVRILACGLRLDTTPVRGYECRTPLPWITILMKKFKVWLKKNFCCLAHLAQRSSEIDAL